MTLGVVALPCLRARAPESESRTPSAVVGLAPERLPSVLIISICNN